MTHRRRAVARVTEQGDGELALVRRNRAWLALGASPWLIGLGIALAVVTRVYPLLATLFIIGALWLSLAYKSLKDAAVVPGRVTVGPRGLSRLGRIIVAREHVTQGFVFVHEGSAYVRLSRRGLRPSLLLRARSRAKGRDVLRTLGLDATQTAAEIKAGSRLLTMSRATLLALLVVPILGVSTIAALLRHHWAPAQLSVIALSFVYVFGLVLTPTMVRVGADGVLLRWLGRERFVPFSAIRRSAVYREKDSIWRPTSMGVALELDGDERVKIPTGHEGWGEASTSELAERIEEALEAHRAATSRADTTALARRGASPLAWVLALRRIGAGANADLRTAPVPIESLLRVVQDPEASAALRASAAVAAMPHATDAEKHRIRVAANATAEPKLRIALDTASREGATDEEIAEALAELDADTATPPKLKPEA